MKYLLIECPEYEKVTVIIAKLRNYFKKTSPNALYIKNLLSIM